MFTLTNNEIEIIISAMLRTTGSMTHTKEFNDLLDKLLKEYKIRESSIKIIKNSFYGKCGDYYE